MHPLFYLFLLYVGIKHVNASQCLYVDLLFNLTLLSLHMQPVILFLLSPFFPSFSLFIYMYLYFFFHLIFFSFSVSFISSIASPLLFFIFPIPFKEVWYIDRMIYLNPTWMILATWLPLLPCKTVPSFFGEFPRGETHVD